MINDQLLTKHTVLFIVVLKTECAGVLSPNTFVDLCPSTQSIQTVLQCKKIQRGTVMLARPNEDDLFAVACTQQQYEVLPERIYVQDLHVFDAQVDRCVQLLTTQPPEVLLHYSKQLFELCQQVETLRLQ